MDNYSEELHVNVGTGDDIQIGELAKLVKDIVEFEGNNNVVNYQLSNTFTFM
jgi:GDP-L-fucose synthase